MWLPEGERSVQPPESESKTPPGSWRDRLALLLGLATVVCLASTFFLSKGTLFLMPGPLTSAHGAIEKCDSCHTKSGDGKLSWLRGLVAGDPAADSKACLACHKMPDTALNAHGASAEVLKQSTQRLAKISAEIPQPHSARAQSIAFPTDGVVARGLYCATCHQEHQGVNFKLNKISNEQCRSCHVVKFDSFDGHHPKFESYPFKRRTRLIYDHAGHFDKHFPEVAKKDPARRIPATCSACHDSREDKRVMAVAPFEQTCTACHVDQITGKARASGPKGIAFLALPGLDLQTLKKKNAAIGEWPDASDATLTPFMKVMISRDERGRALLKTVDSVNLQDLTTARDDQINAVTDLAWEIKGLVYALIKGKASDVLGDLDTGSGAKLSASLVADLTASIPRDVLIGAQQQWLPNLGTEMASRHNTGVPTQGGWSAETKESSTPVPASPKEPSRPEAEPAPSSSAQSVGREEEEGAPGEADLTNAKPESGKEDVRNEEASKTKTNPQACIVRVLGQCLVSNGPEGEAASVQSEGVAGQAPAASPESDAGKEKSSTEGLPPPMQAGLKDAGEAPKPEGDAGKTEPASTEHENGKDASSAGEPPRGNPTDQTDDLLFPTESELRAMKAANQGTGKGAQPEGASGGAAPAESAPDANANAPASSGAAPQTRAAPVINIESDVDPESWAEYGGWYRQDYAILYRPTGHKDKFIYSWLFLTGPHAPRGDASPAAAVFDFLTSKDAPGSCTKCHSVDDIQSKGRMVNFSPPSAQSKQGRFTNFIHEPHFGIMETRGCLTCHDLEKGGSYLKSYEQGNPQSFVSNFGEVKKDLCQSCHTSSMARQDCLACHKYHVNGVITPIMTTRIPTP